MNELLEACLNSPVNLALSVMLVLAAAYWLIVIIAGLGVDSLDFDIDTDTDIDLDADVDAHHSFGASGTTALIRLMGVGEVPLLILLTVFLFLLWAVGVMSYPFVGQWGILLQLVMLIPAAIVSLIVTSVLTWPLRAIFRKLKEQEKAEQNYEFIGKRVVITSLTADTAHGQAEIETPGAPLRLNVRTNDPALKLNKGDEAVIVSEDDASGLYYVKPF